jgi:hypothetical protein
MAETIYLNGIYCKKKNYGISISGKASDVIAEIQKHTNSKGYIRLELKERKEADKNGNTHYLIVDTWEPTPGQQTGQQQRPSMANPNSYQQVEDDGSDLPF